MRKKIIAAAVIAATVLLAACASAPQRPAAGGVIYKDGNVTYANQAEFLAAIQRQTDAFVAQVAPTRQRLGGTLLVVLPSTATMRRIWTRIEVANTDVGDLLPAMGEIYLVANAQAVEQGHAFDSVRIIRADAPELTSHADHGGPDYVLCYTTKHKWTLFNRAGAASELGVPNAKAERVAQLSSFNISVLNAAADLGARVVRQPLATGPA